MSVSAVLLAAGESTRMGTLKALLPWGEGTLLEYQVAQLRASRCGEMIRRLITIETRLRNREVCEAERLQCQSCAQEIAASNQA